MKHPRLSAIAVVLLALGTLSACGSDDSGDGDSATSASASAGAGGAQPGGDPTQLAAIQQCLEAAGLSDAMPSGMPSGMPSDGGTPPSGMPTDMPTDMPSGMPSGGPAGGGQGAFQDPEVQAALQACGITLPSPSTAPGDQATG